MAFAASTLERWLGTRRRHELAWARPWRCSPLGRPRLLRRRRHSAGGDWSFKVFYLFGGVLNVPFLALGTVYLLGGRRLGDRVALRWR